MRIGRLGCLLTGLILAPAPRAGAADRPDEKRKGSIEVGKLGDLALLSDDLLTCEADRIRGIKVLGTVVGGKFVHEANPERAR